MLSKQNTYKFTIQLIAEILSFERPIEDLKYKLSSNSIDWEQFVTVSSDHLVLTTCYCRLKQKNLLHYIPNELELYLNNITTINRNRNLSLLKQVNDIASLFNTHDINYVFLKGTALLVGNYFEDIGERMIGDIDILVSTSQIDKAFSLLRDANYKSFVEFNYENRNFRHLPRQINSDKIAAVELHKTVLNANYKSIINEEKLLSQRFEIHKIRIPNRYYLNLCNIIMFQINANGYRFKQWNLKNLYDSLVLKLTQESTLPHQKHVIDYMSKFQVIFKDSKLNLDFKNSKTIKNYNFRLKYYRFYKILYKLSYTIYSLESRIMLLINNKSYRLHIIKNKILLKR